MCASYNCEFIHLLYNVLLESIMITSKETPCWWYMWCAEPCWGEL